MREFLLALLLAALPAAANQLITLKVRGGQAQSYALYKAAGDTPAYALVLFPGGDGVVDYREKGGNAVPSRRGNFLVRSATLFTGDGFAAAVMDVPSDQAGGMSDEFRSGPEHAADVAAVADDLRRRLPGVKVFLVGTSRGTISAAYAGRALGNKVDGVVLSSTVFRGTQRSLGLNGFPFREIASPLLFVHHAEDGCSSCCSYAEARWVTGFPMITVKGGNTGTGNPCEAQSHHGYLGQERDVVAAIRNWAAGRPYPKVIE